MWIISIYQRDALSLVHLTSYCILNGRRWLVNTFAFWKANLPATESVIWENLHQSISQIHKNIFANPPKMHICWFTVIVESPYNIWTYLHFEKPATESVIWENLCQSITEIHKRLIKSTQMYLPIQRHIFVNLQEYICSLTKQFASNGEKTEKNYFTNPQKKERFQPGFQYTKA